MADRVPVAVIVLNWNGREVTRDCLRSWAVSNPAPACIMVVDNGSTDGSGEMVRAEFPSVELLVLPANVGYAAGNNAGLWALKDRGFGAVFFCNNDTEVGAGMLGELWTALDDHPRWSSVGPKILFHDSWRVWFLGGWVSRLTGNPGHAGYGDTDREAGPPFELPGNGFITGCGLLMRYAVARELGGFDEGTFMYAEDSDMCFRARERGWGCGIVPSARMTHKVSATSGLHSPEYYYYVTRNSLHLIRRHRLGFARFLWPVTATVFAIVVTGWRIARATVSGRPAVAWALLGGVLDFLRGKRGRMCT